MWTVEVIVEGGKVIAWDSSRERETIQKSYNEFKIQYPNASVIMEYMSQNVRGLGQNKRKKGKLKWDS